MKALLIEYLKIRLHAIPLFGLTILLSMLVLSSGNRIEEWLFSFLFLAISILAFRILDDAFSVEIDRENHPQRTYLVPRKFNLFKKLTTLTVAIYLLVIGIVFPMVFLYILMLLLGSLVLYVLFRKQRFVLRVIPLLKYPVLLYCIAIVSLNQVEVGVLLASFLLLAGFDSFDSVKRNSNHIWKPILLLLGCGVFLFKPWLNPYDILFCLLPLFILYLLRNKSMAPYFAILYYPILFFTHIH